MPAQILKLELAAAFINASPTPSVANVGAAGAVTYTYKLVALNAAGQHAAAGTAGSTATGNATLNGTNFNRITWTDSADVDVVSYDVYRTVGGATQGKIGNVLQGVHTIDDTGLAGDAATAPATNTTGEGKASSVVHLDHKTIQVSGGGVAFTGSVQIVGSIDGVEFENVGSAIVAPGFVDVPRSYGLLRADTVSLSAGAFAVYVAGTGYGKG